jgi:hypothetical protein
MQPHQLLQVIGGQEIPHRRLREKNRMREGIRKPSPVRKPSPRIGVPAKGNQDPW